MRCERGGEDVHSLTVREHVGVDRVGDPGGHSRVQRGEVPGRVVAGPGDRTQLFGGLSDHRDNT